MARTAREISDARNEGYGAGKARMLEPMTDQEAALKLANILSIHDNDASRGEVLVEKRIEVMNILSRIAG